MRASNAGATLNEPARFTEAVLFEPTAWKSCEGYVYGDRHSASPATAAPPPSLPLPLSHRSRRHPAEPTRLAGSPSRMERQRRSGLWLGAWECRRQHAQRSMPGAAPSVPTTFVDEGGRWPIATIVTKCSLSGEEGCGALAVAHPWASASSYLSSQSLSDSRCKGLHATSRSSHSRRSFSCRFFLCRASLPSASFCDDAAAC